MHIYYNQLPQESSQEPRFVLVVVYYRCPPHLFRGGIPFKDACCKALESKTIKTCLWFLLTTGPLKNGVAGTPSTSPPDSSAAEERTELAPGCCECVAEDAHLHRLLLQACYTSV